MNRVSLSEFQLKVLNILKDHPDRFIEYYQDVDSELTEITVSDLDHNDYMFLGYMTFKKLFDKQLIRLVETKTPCIRVTIYKYCLNLKEE